MKKYLILIAGCPATGKTYLIEQIKQTLKDVFVITPDEGKEMLADSVGFSNLEEKAELEKRVWQFYYGVLALYMSAGKQVIVSEYPFSGKQLQNLTQLSEKYQYEVLTIRLIADFDILWKRRQKRDIEPDRHLSHVMKSYHFGDQLEERTKADNLITEKQFEEIINERKYNEFRLGELYEFDVSDFDKVDYQPFLRELKQKLGKQ